jgi:5-hydroxyisourate hydrolase
VLQVLDRLSGENLIGISTHVLDTARGRPAMGVPVSLDVRTGGDWTRLIDSATDENGRAGNLIPTAIPLQRGIYRLRFDAAAYFRAQGVESFYSEICITFEVRDLGEHYHVPLLLSPWGYTTYRGS